MRILLLAQFYPPIMGGVERHVRSLGVALAARGHEVAVATLWQAGQPEFEMDGPVRVHRIRGTMQRLGMLFPVERQHAPPFPDPEVTAALRRLVLAERPDVVHAHNWLVHSFLPIKAWSGARLVMTLHDCEMACVQMRRMYKNKIQCSGPNPIKCTLCALQHYGALEGPATLAANWVMSAVERGLVDMFVPVSDAMAEANGLTGTRTPHQVIPNFVPDDIGEIDPDLDERVAALPQGYILQVGDLARDKGIAVLLEAYAGLASAPPLVLVGRRLPESPHSLPPNVLWIDGLPHRAVIQAWQRSLFGVVPSLSMDGFPTVTLEAMACGRPVIGSEIGGIPDQIVDGATGLLFPPGDVPALREAMLHLLNNDGLRTRMGEAAAVRVRQFMAGPVVDRIEGLYRSL